MKPQHCFFFHLSTYRIMRSKNIHLLIFFACLAISSGCLSFTNQKEALVIEQTLLEIPLDGPITKKKTELSGLAWMGDTLLLLPQYPENFGDPGILFTISKQSISDYLDGKSVGPITPGTIPFFMPALDKMIPHYEGFEAIAIHSDNVYLTIESGTDNHMLGYIISGKISPGGKEIRLDSNEIALIPPPVQLDNRTDETLVIHQNRIYTLFEANGKEIIPSPAAHVFDLDLNALGTITFPHLEYRVTDAAIETDGGIWVINQASSKDADILPPSESAVGTPTLETDANGIEQVERLVKLEIGINGFVPAEYPIIQIELGHEPRNWEGLAILDERGFLLVTDKSPDTLLAFVEMPQE